MDALVFENPTMSYATRNNNQYLMVTVKLDGKLQNFWALNSDDLDDFVDM